MSSDFPTFSEQGEQNVREWVQRTQFRTMMRIAPPNYLENPRQREEP